MPEVDNILLLDQTIEDRFLKALLSYEQMAKLVQNLFEPENFSTQLKHKIYATIIWHYKEYQSIPEKDILLIEIKEIYGQQNVTLAERYLARLDDLPVPEWVWILAKIDTWAKTIALHKALYEAADLLKTGNLTSAQERVLTTIRKAGVRTVLSTNDIDLTVSDVQEYVEEEHLFCAPTRIYALDKIIQGIFRKELFIVMAPLNVGKSWAAIHLTTSILMSGKYILYLTLEMSKQRVMQRIIQNVSGAVKPTNENELTREVAIWAEDWETKELIKVPSLLNLKKVAEHVNILKRFGGKLSVKEYASGTATVADIEREVLMFDATFGKPPDVIVVDGLLDIKNHAGSDSRQKQSGLSDIAKELRRLASEYNAGVITTHQGNRDSLTADIVGVEHTGEALAIMQIADTAITLNQTKAEEQMGMLRVFIARARNQKKWQMIRIWQNIPIGQFCQASELVEATYEDDEEEEESSMSNRFQQRRFQRRS